MTERGWVVYTRADCALCEEFLAELSRLVGSAASVLVRDVDADPAARRRFGRKVPVLTHDGRIVCHGRVDAASVARGLAR